MSNAENDERQFVLLIDILGYKELIENNSTEDVFQKIAQLITAVSDFGQHVGNVESYVYADTIVFIPKSNEDDSLAEIIEIAHMALFWSHKLVGLSGEYIPIRGAIGYGEIRAVGPALTTNFGGEKECRADNVQLLMGKGLLDAYEAEQQLELMGIVLSDSAVNAIESLLSEDSEIAENNPVRNLLIEYNCPIKINKAGEKRTIEKKNKFLIKQIHFKRTDWLIPRMEQMVNSHVGDIRDKYQNTVDFLRYSDDLIKEQIRLLKQRQSG